MIGGRSALLAAVKGKPKIKDQSPSPKSLNLNSPLNPSISDVAKIGATSIQFTEGAYIRLNGESVFAFGTNPFTIEAYVRFTNVDIISDIYNGGGTGPLLVLRLDDNRFNIFGASGNSGGATTLVANTWYHVAACKSGTTMRLFVNGSLDRSVTDLGNYPTGPGAPTIGSNFRGYMHLRVTNAARYTSNFTPPTDFPTNSVDDSFYGSVSLLLKGGS